MALNPIGTPGTPLLGSRLEDLQKRVARDVAALVQQEPRATDGTDLVQITHLTTRLRGLRAASESIQYGISLTQTADAALEGAQEGYQRIRELSLHAANGTLTDADWGAIQSEINQLTEGIDSTLAGASFNGESIFGRTIEVTTGPEGRIPLEFSELSVRVLSDGPTESSNVEAAQYSIPRIDQAIDRLGTIRQHIGSLQGRLTQSQNAVSTAAQNVVAASVGQRDLLESIVDLKVASTQLKIALKVSAAQLKTDDTVLELLK